MTLPEIKPTDVDAILSAAAQRVAAIVREKQPLPSAFEFLGEFGDFELYGTFVSLKCGQQLRSCIGNMSVGSKLAASLDDAAMGAAKHDYRFPPISPQELHLLDIEVWLLFSPETIVEKGRDRLAHVEVGRDGLQIELGGRRGVFLPSVPVEQGWDKTTYFEQLCRKASLPQNAWLDEKAVIQKFAGVAHREPLVNWLASDDPAKKKTSVGLSTDEKAAKKRTTPPIPLWLERKPAVAGSFYPDHAIEETLASLTPSHLEPEKWTAAMVPHAGWVYSGQLAMQTLARVEIPDRVLILAPKHTAPGVPWAVGPFKHWLLPHLQLQGDEELVGKIVAEVEDIVPDKDSHIQEHAIEVLLPMLAHFNPKVQVTGVTLTHAPYAQLQKMGRELGEMLRGLPQGERPLILISSDLNHFASEAENHRLDAMALKAMQTWDAQHFYEVVITQNISVCGAAGIVVALEAMEILGKEGRMEKVGYCTSADAGGDTIRVVGYGGMLLR